MTQNLIPIKVFISSPQDLSLEREIVKELLMQLNESPHYRERYTFVPYAYEDRVPSIVGEVAQTTVDMHLIRSDESDILVCMMWLRMGTPLKEINPETNKPYQSGTEYEFWTAYRAYQEQKNPKILLYRCMRGPEDLDQLDVPQFHRVKKFFEQFRKRNGPKGLLKEFKKPEDLAKLLRHDLEELIEKYFKTSSIESISRSQLKQLIYMPSKLPPEYVERIDVGNELRKILLSSPRTSRITTVLITGLAGIGKSVLVQAICQDRTIRGAFPDGILWATIGQNPEPVNHQSKWIAALHGDTSAASSVEGGNVELKRLLDKRNMLLVLDDVWHVQDIEPLNVGGSNCTMLITSRKVLHLVGAALFQVQVMEPDESRILIRKSANNMVDDQLADAISERLGYLPIALPLIGVQLARGRNWDDIQKALDKGRLEFMDHGEGRVLAAIKSSVDNLPTDRQDRYRELIVFPKGEPLVEAAVERLWQQTANLEDFESRLILADFRDQSLIQSNYTIHDLQFDYLRTSVQPDQVQELHSKLVDAYIKLSNWSTLPDDNYAWRYLALHLSLAKRFDDLRSLLTNGSYLQGKLSRLGVVPLLADYALMAEDDFVKSLFEATRQGAHVLGRVPTELLNQLNGRMGSLPDLHTLPVNNQPHFRLQSQTLTPPGGPLLRMLKGHTGYVRGCAFSPNGRYILSASADHTLRLWDATSGLHIRTYQGHTGRVERCAFSPDGQYVLSASWDCTLRLWDISNGRTIRIFEGHSGSLRGCAYSPDSKFVLSASEDRTLRLWSVDSGELLRTFEGHLDTVHGCAFSPNGGQILSASDDATLRLWDIDSAQVIRAFQGHTDKIHGCTFSPDGHFAVSASDDQTLRLWNVADGKCVRSFEGHTKMVHGCAFDSDGTFLLSASNDGTLRLWEVATGKTIRIFEGHSKNVTGCAFGPDDRTAVSAAGDKMLCLWDVTRDYPERPIKSHTSYITDCAFSKDGRFAVSASGDCTLRVWDLVTNQTVRILKGHDDGVFGCTFSPDGRFILSASRDHTLRLWDTSTANTVRIFVGHTDMVEDCIFSPDGNTILSASADKTLKLWDVATGMELHTLEGHLDRVRECTISPDGLLAASTSDDYTVRVWDLTTKELLRVLEGHTDVVRSCSFSPDGSLLLSCANDNTLRLWNIEHGTTIQILKGHTDWVRSCKFSSDGKLALSASSDQTLCLWHIADKTRVAQFFADEALRCSDFDHDRRRVIAGDRSGNLHFLKVEKT